MPATLEEVKRIIQEAFPGSNVDDIQDENHRIGGLIIWQGFKGQDPRERNRLVTEKVRGPLGREGLNVGILLALANPGEK